MSETISGEFPNSSNLDTYTYTVQDRTLTIVFQSGARYAYAGVPRDLIDGLVAAESAGKFFAANIRNAFPYTKLGAA